MSVYLPRIKSVLSLFTFKLIFFAVTLIFFSSSLLANPANQSENRLRNGSFEGGLLYWHGVKSDQHSLVTPGREGAYALRMEHGSVMSAPWIATPGKDYTVSFWIKGDSEGSVRVQMPPSARETAHKAGRLWTREATQSAPFNDQWQRVSFTWTADVPSNGFWPKSHYMVQIESKTPIQIDGVTVTEGKSGTDRYIAHADVEALSICTNLPGYLGAAGNAFNRGENATIAGHFHNPTTDSTTLVATWQLIDYEGTVPVSEKKTETVELAPGETITIEKIFPLDHTGCVLARVTATVDGKVVNQSDFPVTSLPYPKQATNPDFRERFGGSFAGGKGCIEKFQRIGFGWTRWYPESKWHNFQPDGPGSFDWHDESYDIAQSHGVSQHVVLYGWPKWIMEQHGHPLPKDMRWGPADPRWEDLKLETAWDRYVKAAVEHFRGRSVVFEIANEPELDRWDNYQAEYVQFNIRTSRLIRQTHPDAKIMVNNIYAIPSGLNRKILEHPDGLKNIDVISWHDYHSGWLTDAHSLQQMRNRIDAADGKHVEIWFNEGWAFTNTAVDEPPACTGLTSAESTNQQMACVAELTANGQEKIILFHTAYENHGMSFWDYSGPGTMLWDWYDNPLPLLAAWNVLNHHIGLSDEVGFVRPPGANLCIFQDLRNQRGVIVAYADRDASSDVVLNLPRGTWEWVQEDIMGNAKPASKSVVLSQTGRPMILYTSQSTSGATFKKQFQGLDRRHESFVRSSESGETVWTLPAVWDGQKPGTSDNNPLLSQGAPVWRLDRLFPVEAEFVTNYSPMIWGNGQWNAPDHMQAGHPSAIVSDGNVDFGTMGPWGGDQNYAKIPALAFIAPKDGNYHITASVNAKPWDGNSKDFKLSIRKKDLQRAVPLSAISIPRDGTAIPLEINVELRKGHELVFFPEMQHRHNNALHLLINDLQVTKPK
ncbi:carbohydrate binding domain-containing protein [Bremerella sp.]|uniref:carbohydrate binding domain-containing protein n=1 Tax=Bremerella sp. TaxID=2795602 RepID=UPI00391B4607